MIDIIDLKETLTIDEAAAWLSARLSGDITARTIIDLAIEGKLTMSIRVTLGVEAKVYDRICSFEEINSFKDELFKDADDVNLLFSFLDAPDSTDSKNNEKFFVGMIAKGAVFAPTQCDFTISNNVFDIAVAGLGANALQSAADSLEVHGIMPVMRGIACLSDDRETLMLLHNKKYSTGDEESIKGASYVVRKSRLQVFHTMLERKNSTSPQNLIGDTAKEVEQPTAEIKPPYLDEQSDKFSPYLAIAVDIWERAYINGEATETSNKLDPIIKLIEKHYPQIETDTVKKQIADIIVTKRGTSLSKVEAKPRQNKKDKK